jgi:hypothetical protein
VPDVLSVPVKDNDLFFILARCGAGALRSHPAVAPSHRCGALLGHGSDGVWDMVTSEEAVRVVDGFKGEDDAARKLILTCAERCVARARAVQPVVSRWAVRRAGGSTTTRA